MGGGIGPDAEPMLRGGQNVRAPAQRHSSIRAGSRSRRLVDADGGGFGPRAGAFGSDGADVEAEKLADGEAREVEAYGAVGDDREGVPYFL